MDLSTDIARRYSALGRHDTPTVRALRREYTRRLATAPGAEVIRIAERLIGRGVPGLRFMAYELCAYHPAALGRVRARTLRRLGQGLSSWSDVDDFACHVAGPAWRAGQIPDDVVLAWTRSPDRWWRRAALVSTVPLQGDVARTLRICAALEDDRDPMVWKAVSWALRALAKRRPAAVRRFVDRHESALARGVVRETRSKLDTGVKSPRRPRRPQPDGAIPE
jgi:3-methyladenine DNA glycosylase AlkD